MMFAKRLISSVVSLSLVATMLMPMGVYAVENETPAKKIGGKNFCTSINVRSSEIEKRMAEREGKVSQAQIERMSKLTERRAERDDRLQKNRTENEAKRAEQFAKMTGKATTDAQKAAVEAFKVTTANAIATRKAAVDSAMSTFRSGMDALIASRKTSLNGIIAAYKSATSAALAKAKSDCASGVDPDTARATFQASMKGAKDKMQTDRKALEKVGASAEALAKTRNASVKNATEAFQVTMKTARTTLQNAMK